MSHGYYSFIMRTYLVGSGILGLVILFVVVVVPYIFFSCCYYLSFADMFEWSGLHLS